MWSSCTRLPGACGLVADPSRAIARCRLDQLDRLILRPVHCKPSRMGHDPGGFRLWWRQLTGSDATLDNAHVAEDYLARTPTMYRIIAVGRTCSVPRTN